MLNKIFLSNNEILRRIRENDRTILGELYVTNERAITSYIKRNGGNSSDAQDLLQDAIIILWQKINSGKFDLSAKVSTYLFAIAKNKWMAESRRKKKFSNEINLEEKAADTNSLNDLIDNEEKNIITEALQELESPCKELLLLFYFEERKMADIAKILNFANSDVAKAKKYQCKKALEKLLQAKLK